MKNHLRATVLGVAAVGLGFGAWYASAIHAATAARKEVEERVSQAMDSGEFELASPKKLRAYAEDTMRLHFGREAEPLAVDWLLAEAVHNAVAREISKGSSGSFAGPLALIESLGHKPSAQALAEALVEAATRTPTEQFTRPSGETVDLNDWRAARGRAMLMLNLADAMDLRRPLPLLYLQRAALNLMRPDAASQMEYVLQDLQTSADCDLDGKYAAMRSMLEKRASQCVPAP